MLQVFVAAHRGTFAFDFIDVGDHRRYQPFVRLARRVSIHDDILFSVNLRHIAQHRLRLDEERPNRLLYAVLVVLLEHGLLLLLQCFTSSILSGISCRLLLVLRLWLALVL